MKVAANLFICLTAIACMLMLVTSIYPGILNDLLFVAFLLSLLVAPIAGISGTVLLIVLAVKGKLRAVHVPWSRAGIAIMILLTTYLLLKFYVPRRIAFAFSRSAFEPFVTQAPQSSYKGIVLNQNFGLYHVDEYAADPRGGVYFRVYTGGDGIGPDLMSYGFAYKPNAKGTPFGAARYRVFRLRGDWYWFRASDDWY